MGDRKVYPTNDIHISPRNSPGATSGRTTMSHGDTLFRGRPDFEQIFTQC